MSQVLWGWGGVGPTPKRGKKDGVLGDRGFWRPLRELGTFLGMETGASGDPSEDLVPP